MDLHSAERLARRARKRLAHAVRVAAEAKSERARHRHARRAFHAARLAREADDWLQELASVDDESGAYA